MRLAPILVSLALASVGCDPAPARDAASSSAPSAAPGGNATPSGSAAATAPAPSASAPAPSASVPAPAMPKSVTECEATARQWGDFTPSVDELVRADAALPSASCLARDAAEASLRACAAKVGKTSLSISTDRLGEAKSGCQVAVSGAGWQGRRFVVFFELRRDVATFFGGPRVVELTADGAKLYLDAFDTHAELCPTAATTGKLPPPAALPAGWMDMPKELQAFLCGTD